MRKLKLAAFFITIFLLLTGCASGPKASMIGNDELDIAIRELSDYLNKRVPKNSKVVFLNIRSDWPDFSEYILSSLTENAVNDDLFTIVDRRELDVLRAELNFQYSGEVSDKSAQLIGETLGAQTIVSGSVTEVGNEYRVQVRAISVQTAAVQGLSSQNVSSKGTLVTALTSAPAEAAALAAKREEEAQKREVESIKRQEAADNFLKKSGVNFGASGSYLFERKTALISGGVDIELRLFKFFGLQSGFEIFQDVAEPKEAGKNVSKQIATQNVLQIPVMARFTIPIAVNFLAVYGGLGINLFPFDIGSPATVNSVSPYSFIVGGDFGLHLMYLQVYISYKYNRDLTETRYSFNNNDYTYLGQRSMLGLGVKFMVPFRKSEQYMY